MVITDEVEISSSGQINTTGGFADIKQGEYKGCAVAVKTMRVSASDDFDKIRKVSLWIVFTVKRWTYFVVQQFCKEVIIWNSLSHPNVLNLIGVLDGFMGHQFITVSEWMVHGNVMEYIRKNATNRLMLVSTSRFHHVQRFLLRLIVNTSYTVQLKD